MKYLLLITLISYPLSYWAYKVADRPGDDFGAGAVFWVSSAVSIVLTLIYIALAFWNHRFW